MVWKDEALTVACDSAREMMTIAGEWRDRCLVIAEKKLIGKTALINFGGGAKDHGKIINVVGDGCHIVKINFVMRKLDGEWSSFVRVCRLDDILEIVE